MAKSNNLLHYSIKCMLYKLKDGENFYNIWSDFPELFEMEIGKWYNVLRAVKCKAISRRASEIVNFAEKRQSDKDAVLYKVKECIEIDGGPAADLGLYLHKL